MKFITGLFAILLTAQLSLAAPTTIDSTEATFSSQIYSHLVTEEEIQSLDAELNRDIERVLRRERRAKQVGEALRIKRSGLRYVQNMADFYRLSSWSFENPSNAYKDAVADFIISHAADFIYDAYDIEIFIRLEIRLRKINQVISHKRSGLVAVQTLQDFDNLTDLVFNNPSDGMLEQRGLFVAQYANQTELNPRDLARYFPSLEQKCKKVVHAIQLRNALLPKVRSAREYIVMARNHFSNPSDALVNSVSEWISNTVRHVIQPRTRIAMIIRIEAQTTRVSHAISVKTAGLRAVQQPEDFWHLTEYAFKNSTASYRNAVSDFVNRYSDQYGR